VPTAGVRFLAVAGARRTVFAAMRRGSASRPALMELVATLRSSERCSIVT
jgi:hypothetical protein